MYSHITSAKLFICAVLFLLGVNSCSMMKDDLSDCPSGVWVKLDVSEDLEYRPKYSAESFADDMNHVTLWVFDENGVYIDKFSESSAVLKQNNNTMNLPIAPGKYQMVAWTGIENINFDVPAMTAGVSVMDDLKVRVARDASSRYSRKLPSVWNGSIANVEVKPFEYTYLTVRLTKHTNTVNIVLHDTSGKDLDSDDFTFEIVAENGYMDYNSRLLSDADVIYNAYFLETAQVSDDNNAAQQLSVARAELNTLRLMADKPSRFVVTNKITGATVLSINLTEYLLLTRESFNGSNGTTMSPQAYLDYEDMYRLVFFLSPTSNSYIITSLRINGWIIRINNADL